jgi:hypothetical protein
MVKKIVLAILLVSVTSVLIWGGGNRTQAKMNEGNSSKNRREGQNYGAVNIENAGYGQSSSTESHGTKGVGRSNFGVNETYGGEFSVRNSGNGYRGGENNNTSARQDNRYESLDDSEVQALKMALDDEYHALAVYQSVIEAFGPVDPFVEISQSEQRHIVALVNQFDKNGIPVPDNTWLDNVPTFDSIQSACQTAVEAEIANVDLYKQLLSMTDDPGLIQVFTNLSQASQDNHLPQFQSCQ